MRSSLGGKISRRTLLSSFPAALLAGSSYLGRRAHARGGIPYVDGLTFLSGSPRDLADSGLTAFISDVSGGEQIETPEGKRFVRTFESCTRSITQRRRQLRSDSWREAAFLATRGSEIPAARESGKCAVFFQFQGCEPLGTDLSRMDLFYELGLRVLQISHHHNNAFGGGAMERTWTGLTPLGIEGVERMNLLGIIPDLSHASDPTSMDVLETSKKPVILSHGAARAIVNNARCVPDEVIKGVADSGGVMGIFMMSFWLTTDPQPSVEHYLAQLRHVVKVGGWDAVGIANDYSIAGESELARLGNNNAEGIKNYYPWWDSMTALKILGFDRRPTHVVIPELNHVRRLFSIHEALEKARFTSSQIEKIMGGNWIRVLRDSLG